MNSFDDLLSGKLIKKEDVQTPQQFTISGFEKGEVKGENGVEKVTFMTFEETDRRIIVKPHVVEALKTIFGDGSGPAQAVGNKVELFNDPSVKMGLKKVGGLRLRAPSAKTGAAPF